MTRAPSRSPRLSRAGTAARLSGMTHTHPTSITATPHDGHTDEPPRPTFGEMLEEVIDLSVGLGVALLPLLVLIVPAIVLFVVLPAILLLAVAAPLAAIGAMIAAPPYLLARWVRRRRRALSPAGLVSHVAAVGK